MANYEDWKSTVEDELKARGLDVAEANDWYSWCSAWEDGMKPNEAVKDYQDWMAQ
jgi:hypothetical protein